MNLKKKIFILFSMFFLFTTTEIFAAEEFEAGILNVITKENNYNPVIEYNYEKNKFPEFERRDYLFNNRLNLGTPVKNIKKFDLRDIVDIDIQNQEKTSLCWLYSTNSIIETKMKKNNIHLNTKFDVVNIDREITKVYNKLSSEGIGAGYQGGSQLMAFNYYISGKGPKNINNQKMEIEVEDFVIFPSLYKEKENNKIKYYGTSWVTGEKIEYTAEQALKIRNKIKEHILENGAVSANIYSSGVEFYDDTTNIMNAENFYCNDSSKMVEHAVTIIGWDDNYSKENFNSKCRPINDGAYIVLNSWGEEFSTDGVYYISYDDCFIESTVYGIEKVSEIDHDTIYQHDELGIDMSGFIVGKEAYGANVFKRDGNSNEYLTEVGISNFVDSSYEIYVNPNGGDIQKSKLIKVMETQELPVGYHTLELSEPIKLTGSEFAIVVKYMNSYEENIIICGVEKKITDYDGWAYAENSDGESFLSNDMQNWKDINEIAILEGANLTIKAFTEEKEKLEPETELNINLNKYKETKIEDKTYLMNIEPQTKVSDLKNKIVTNGNLIVEADENESLKTGMKMEIALSNQKAEYIIVVAGDVDWDGDVDFRDMARINKYRLGKIKLPNVELLAGDVNKDNCVDIKDMFRINKYRLGKINNVLVY